jgi:hypothetical protein
MTRLFSSYDRMSVAPDKPGWFANNDYSQFIREEKNGDRVEQVMLDANGPGAIVRFWVTVAGTDGSGILRIYLDQAEKPVIEDKVLEVVSGGKLCAEPLSSSVSPMTNYLRRGHDLYLPIPYAKHCKITYESPTVVPATPGDRLARRQAWRRSEVHLPDEGGLFGPNHSRIGLQCRRRQGAVVGE